MSVHIYRCHKNRYNPLPGMKLNRRVIFFDSNSPQPTKQATSTQNPPKNDLPDSLDSIYKTMRVQNVIKEINQMNIDELNVILFAINRIYANR